jgi:hypothetical protein
VGLRTALCVLAAGILVAAGVAASAQGTAATAMRGAATAAPSETVFAAFIGGPLEVEDPDGSHVTPVPGIIGPRDPALSLDGVEIAFQKYRETTHSQDLYTIDVGVTWHGDQLAFERNHAAAGPANNTACYF